MFNHVYTLTLLNHIELIICPQEKKLKRVQPHQKMTMTTLESKCFDRMETQIHSLYLSFMVRFHFDCHPCKILL